jgi:hypothetical protein
MPGVIGNPLRVQSKQHLNSSSSQKLQQQPQTKRLAEDLSALLDGSLSATSDVVFVVGEQGQSFKAHKSILAARSSYFRSMLLNGMADSSRSEHEVPSWNPECFASVLRWIYTDVLHVPASQDAVCNDVFSSLVWQLWEVR